MKIGNVYKSYAGYYVKILDIIPGLHSDDQHVILELETGLKRAMTKKHFNSPIKTGHNLIQRFNKVIDDPKNPFSL